MKTPQYSIAIIAASFLLLSGCAGAAEYIQERIEQETEEQGRRGDEAETTAEQRSAPSETLRPGEGAWANYDFVPGERVLFYEDFRSDRIGDFPRRLEFVRGNWEVVEWNGQPYLRNTGPRGAAFRIQLPEALPERFTIEMEVFFPHGNQRLAVFFTEGSEQPGPGSYNGQYLHIAGNQSTGVVGRGDGTVESTNRAPQIHEDLAPVRFMVDGTYLKAYVEEQRVANAPNVVLPRTRTLYVSNTYFADQENPMLIGPIRIAAGGARLYQTLERNGRVATRGILFDTGSAELRPESTPTLTEIGQMLERNANLRLRIEGHTDNTGGAEANRALSQRRAESVRQYLMRQYGIDGARLEAVGMGSSEPVADNSTPEGRQSNRRVELVRL